MKQNRLDVINNGSHADKPSTSKTPDVGLVSQQKSFHKLTQIESLTGGTRTEEFVERDISVAVQVNLKPKFRSKSTQCKSINRSTISIATPIKVDAATIKLPESSSSN